MSGDSLFLGMTGVPKSDRIRSEVIKSGFASNRKIYIPASEGSRDDSGTAGRKAGGIKQNRVPLRDRNVSASRGGADDHE